MAFQLMGGDMQAQGHAQMVVNMVDLGANLQASTDMARFRHNQVPNELELETELFNLVGAKLTAMGHKVEPVNGSAMGGFQSILFVRSSELSTPGKRPGTRRLLSRRLRPSQGRSGGRLVGAFNEGRRRLRGRRRIGSGVGACVHFARRQSISLRLPPSDEAGLTYTSTSSVMAVICCFC